MGLNEKQGRKAIGLLLYVAFMSISGGVFYTYVNEPSQKDVNTTSVGINSLSVCDNGRYNGSKDRSVFPNELITVFSILLPLIPVVVFKHEGQKWNSDKTSAIVSHIIGQSSSFGTSEMAKYVVTSDPNGEFWNKCNLSIGEKECNSLYQTYNKTKLTDLCDGNYNDLYGDLHSSPNEHLVMLGAASAAFVYALWMEIFKNNINVPFSIKLGITACFISLLTFILVDQYLKHLNTLSEIFLSFVYGCMIQVFIQFMLLKKRDGRATPPPPAVTTEQ